MSEQHEGAGEGARIAAVAAEYIASMFNAAMGGRPIDIKGAADVGCAIVDRVAEDGLTPWLETVRNHHEGTYQHCLLVAGVSADFGLTLGFGAQDMERLGLAAMLHDIGKANVPLAVLDKRGRLNNEERALIETHPVIGFDKLDDCPGISSEILDVVRHHHEYLDGSGYPDGLCGESISDLTRIVTISDIFSALIERRSYKPTMPREEAFKILSSMQGKLEMPLVSAFRKVALSR
jgi:putative nucleotidyltransferase with HDIG domain